MDEVLQSPILVSDAGLTDEFNATDADDQDEEEFVYPGVTVLEDGPAGTKQLRPSPAQMESLFAAASSGDLNLLKKLFKNALDSGVDYFSLANDAASRTGSTALHAAASRGYVNIVIWLIEDCGAMPDLEDREGETALHRAALNGHLNIVQYLTERGADVHARDADGWTALHNACSKGYLDLVRWLCENADGICEIDTRNKDGWTPLMNASSKGHLPVVLYLLRQAADPLIRNKWGETAFDTAAAVFQVWICEILQQAEAEHWHDSKTPYNPLAVHTTLPIIIYENQKLDARLKTLAVSGGHPIFSASGLGRQGRRPPFEIKFPKPKFSAGVEATTAWRSNIQLPFRDSPWDFPQPGRPDRQTAEGDDRSHFWLSEWTFDVTHPKVDAKDGWQYAHDFDDPDDRWTAEKSPALDRLLNDGGIVASSARSPQSWIRRRRWVRIMRRRIDAPPLPFLQPDGGMYYLTSDGGLIPFVDQTSQVDNGQELGTMAPTFLSSAQDYVARSRYLVGNQTKDGDTSYPSRTASEIRRSIAKLERATAELRQGILGDEEGDRKTQAEVLLNVYSRELERLRLTAGARGWSIISERDVSEEEELGSDGSDEEFHYPGASVEDRQSSSGVSSSMDLKSRSGVLRGPTDLTPQLSQAPDFRVPTREAPQGLSSRRAFFSSQQSTLWEKDESVAKCRDCQRQFNLLTRKHHCRKCGQIFCDSCSAFRTLLDPSEIVNEPGRLASSKPPSSQRVCRTCYEVTASLSFQNKPTSIKPIYITSKWLIPSSAKSKHHTTQFGDLLACPVCKSNFEQLGDIETQKKHAKDCLERAEKYIVYTLTAGSALVNSECALCFEKFAEGSGVARLSCLCSYHNSCLSAWLQRGKNCPIHAR